MCYFVENQIFMQLKQTSVIVIASSLALIALIIFQLKWLQQSRELVEEQFDQKVTMALCTVSEDLLEKAQEDASPAQAQFDFLCKEEGGVQCGTGFVETAMSKEEVKGVLDVTLDKYAIDLDYRFDIVPAATNSLNDIFPVKREGYSCKLGNDETETMQIQFLGRDDYVSKKIGWMTAASIVLLLSVSSLFLITLFQLVKQQRLNQWNIDFFNNMAHEFRTPLTNSQLALNRLQKKSPIPESNRYIQIIESENARLLEQVERVLHISRLESGDMIMKSSNFSLDNLLQEVVEEMDLQAKEKGGFIHLDAQTEQAFTIKGDRLHVGNAIRNVLDNAIKYCEQAPQIMITWEQANEYVKLSITDNGIGIDHQHRHTIFQKFYRVTKGNQYFQKGFGLGLSYVKNVVEKHAGFLTVQSQPKKGSTFSLFFPIQNA